ncbi:hypothetical protein [Paraburkholderia sp. 2C]
MSLMRSLRLGLSAWLWMRDEGVRERFGLSIEVLLACHIDAMGGLAGEW